MKLFEEFKEYETMWEDVTEPTVEKPIKLRYGGKEFDLHNIDEFKALVETEVSAQVKNYKLMYYKDKSYNQEVKQKIFEELVGIADAKMLAQYYSNFKHSKDEVAKQQEAFIKELEDKRTKKFTKVIDTDAYAIQRVPNELMAYLPDDCIKIAKKFGWLK